MGHEAAVYFFSSRFYSARSHLGVRWTFDGLILAFLASSHARRQEAEVSRGDRTYTTCPPATVKMRFQKFRPGSPKSQDRPWPYLAGKSAEDFQRGVNFAVGGATALGPDFFKSRGLKPFVPVSFTNQTTWFKNVLQLLGSVHNRTRIMASSLFIVGEIGVNDYLVAFAGNTTVEEARALVPHIVGAVRSVVTEVLAAGARTVLVPGMISLGCEPQLLALYQSGNNTSDHDPESGCIKPLNDLAELHNRALNGVLRELRRAHPGTAILYADLYGAVADLIASPRKYGFRNEPLAACCGGSGVYNFNMTAFCGAAGTAACADPSE